MGRIKRILKNIINSILDRETYIRMAYLHDYSNGEYKKTPLYYSITINTWRKSTIMMELDIDSAREVAKLLTSTIGPVKITKGDSGCYQYIIIPKWAKEELSKQISRVILS